MAERTPVSARPIRQSGAPASAATARAAEVLHLPLPETLLQHPFRKDAILPAGAGHAATGTITPADVGATVSSTGHQAVTIAAITIRVPAVRAMCLHQAVNQVSLCVITTVRVVEVRVHIIVLTVVVPVMRVQETVGKVTPLIRIIYGMAADLMVTMVTASVAQTIWLDIIYIRPGTTALAMPTA